MLINLQTCKNFLQKTTKSIYDITSQKRTKSPITSQKRTKSPINRVNDINLDAKNIAQKLEIDDIELIKCWEQKHF